MTESQIATDAVQRLVQLGFTRMEAEVYVALLRESPATGYRIATSIGKATANTYKALRSLAEKGAVLIEDGDSSRYRAVPAKELLSQFTRTFERQRDDAREILEKIDIADEDRGVYRLTDYAQVIQRAREMLARATQVALVTSFPIPLAQITPDLETAAARGVDIGVKIYVEAEIRGVDIIMSTTPQVWLDQMPGEELTLTIDAEEHLIAHFDGEYVLQAIWSASPFLSSNVHNGMALEHHVTRLTRAIQNGVSTESLRDDFPLARNPLHAPGFRRLQQIAKLRRRRDASQ